MSSSLAYRWSTLNLVIVDPQGKTLYHLREKLFVVDRTFIAEDETGAEVFRLVKKRFSCECAQHASRGQQASSRLLPVKAKMEVTLQNRKEGTSDVLSLRGGFWGVEADITLGPDGSGPVVAQINRNPWTMKDLLADKQTVSWVTKVG